MLRRYIRNLIRILLYVLWKHQLLSAIVGKPLDKVEYKIKYNIKDDNDLVIGEAAKKCTENEKVNLSKDSRINEFYRVVVQFFQAACDYLIAMCPVLIHAEITDTALQVFMIKILYEKIFFHA